MTTDRSHEHHQQQQQQQPPQQHRQRRPPDVEAALSSMLWTPYERSSPTDSSSADDDDDERLNRQLRKSPARSLDYRHRAPPPPSSLTGVSYFGVSPDDLSLPGVVVAAGQRSSSAAPFVPFSSLLLSGTSGGETSHGKTDDATAATFRFSYPYYGPIPSLNKWWSSASGSKEPPSYESLYSRSTPRSRHSMRTTRKPAIATISSSRDEPSSLDGDRAQASPFGRLVHSFTDNFVSENYSRSSLVSPQLSHCSTVTLHEAPSVPPGPPRVTSCSIDDVTEAEVQQRRWQQQQLESERQRLAALESHARKANETNARSQQNEQIYNSNCNNNNENNSNCIARDQSEYHALQRQGQAQQPQQHHERSLKWQNAAGEEEGEDDDIDDDDDEEEGDEEGAKEVAGDREQVNQPVSFAGECTTPRPTTTTTLSSVEEQLRRVNSTTPTAMNSSGALSRYDAGAAGRRSWRTGSFVENSLVPSTIHSFSVQSSVDSFSCESTVSVSGSLFRVSRAPLEHFGNTLPPESSPSPAFDKSSGRWSTSTAAVVADYALVPNKCLAELERLYAEFRASESLVERRYSSASAPPVPTTEQQRRGRVSPPTSATSVSAMRLNVPATSADGATTTVVVAPSTSGPANGASSVFLTPTNSVTTNCGGNNNNNNSNPCQRQPSLTIQVNNNNNNHHNYRDQSTGTNSNNNNNNNNSINNNGVSVSVVKCSYVRPNSGVVDDDDDGDNNNTRNNYNCNNLSNNDNEVNNNHGDDHRKSVSVYSSSSSVPNVVCSGDRSVATRNRNVATTTTAIGEDSVNVISVNNPPKSTASPNRQPTSTTATTAKTTPTPTSTPTSTPTRTFASTQCQTDDFEPVQMRASQPPTQPVATAAATATATTTSSREQRRRERRERRHHQQQLLQHQQHQHQQHQQQQQQQQHNLSLAAANHRRHPERHSLPPVPPLPMAHLHPPHMHHHHHHHHQLPPPAATMPAAMSAMLRPMLPDILHSHFPPPYSALPLNAGNCGPGGGGGGGNNGAGGGGCPPVPPPPMIGPPPPPVAPPPPPGTTLLTPVISTVPIPGAAQIVSDGRFTLPLPIIRRSPSERSGKGCCGQWFAGPPLRALIAVVALGGVACALGGAALGATGLAGPPSSHLTAALLMIGVGVVLVTVSGAAWRMTAPGGPPCLGLGSSVDLGRCGRRPCSRGGGAPHGLLYPEFQHRPPPPSYQASMQEYRLRLLLLDRDRQNGVVRGNSPPPTYRSHAGSLLRAPLTTTIRGAGSGSIGGSEYSLPPSYRSRNTTPATVCSERSIETAPSGRLLANEDIPEPLSVDHLQDYRAAHLQQRSSSEAARLASSGVSKGAAGSSRIATTPHHHQVRTSAIVEIEACHESPHSERDVIGASQPSEKLNPRVYGLKERAKELVTIVTISQGDSRDVSSEAGAGTDQIEILAHL